MLPSSYSYEFASSVRTMLIAHYFIVRSVQWSKNQQILKRNQSLIFQASNSKNCSKTMSDESKRKAHADQRKTDNIADGNANNEDCSPVQQRKKQRLQEFKDQQSVTLDLTLEQLQNQLLQQQIPVLPSMFQWEIQPKLMGQGQQQTSQVQLLTQQIFRNLQWNQIPAAPAPLQLKALIKQPQQSPLRVENQNNERESVSPKSDQEEPTQQEPPNRDALPKKDSVTIAQHVPEKIKQAIRESKYVDLVKLLKENSLDEEGDLIFYKLMSKHSGRKEAIKIRHDIDGITTWVKAFTVYMVIYLEAFPESAASLAEYINKIFEWNDHFKWLAVYQYDIDLRRKRENAPETSWVAVDVELEGNMRSRPVASPVETDNTCRHYNGNSCTKPRCRFAHVCLYCGMKGHPVIRCWHEPRVLNVKQM